MILDVKLICPKCGCESPFKAFQAPEEILEISRLAAKFGRAWPWVEEYLSCFRPALDKPLKPARMKIILEELLRFIDPSTGSGRGPSIGSGRGPSTGSGCGFEYDGKFYPVRSDAIYEAVRYVAQTNKMGFKNHNYLKKVAIDMNLKMIQKDEKEQDTRAQEALHRDPRGPEKIKELIKSIGRE